MPFLFLPLATSSVITLPSISGARLEVEEGRCRMVTEERREEIGRDDRGKGCDGENSPQITSLYHSSFDILESLFTPVPSH